jgi:hypothetical protein
VRKTVISSGDMRNFFRVLTHYILRLKHWALKRRRLRLRHDAVQREVALLTRLLGLLRRHD